MALETGHLRKKGKYYYYKFSINNKIREVATGETTLRKAEKRAITLYEEYKILDALPSSQTVADFLEDYVERYYKTDRALSTKKEVEMILLKRILPVLGHKTLKRLKASSNRRLLSLSATRKQYPCQTS